MPDGATINQPMFMCFPLLWIDINAACNCVTINKDVMKRITSTFISDPIGMFGNFVIHEIQLRHYIGLALPTCHIIILCYFLRQRIRSGDRHQPLRKALRFCRPSNTN